MTNEEAEALIREYHDYGYLRDGCCWSIFLPGEGFGFLGRDTDSACLLLGESVWLYDLCDLYPFAGIDSSEKTETSPEDNLKCPQCDRTRPVQIESGELRCWWCEYTGSWHSFSKA